MLKKIALTCCVAASLSACKQEVVGTLYVRDLLEVLETKKDIPVDISINIYEMGIAKKCNDPKSDQIVKAVAAQFQSATLAGCEVVKGSMRDRMTIKATTVLTAPEGRELSPGKYLLQFDAMKTPVTNNNKQVDGLFFIAHFSRDKYEEIRKAIRAVDMMANIDLEEVDVKISINNDLRSDVVVIPTIGSFVDGHPVDVDNVSLTLQPRKEIEAVFGNVKSASLTMNQWAAVATLFEPDSSDKAATSQ
ncbi:hypothetical protein [Brucella tritici]|uniref:DUF7424 domain-containing protein n=1 Tax=Brucella tritici TaxID=94626 RepID=A0A6L3Y7Z1_9HYPH|nr:hypothetical protein [Brucella tritici]KAB2680021.1 hypothetical protein F9L08_21730 [Brucella tritici]